MDIANTGEEQEEVQEQGEEEEDTYLGFVCSHSGRAAATTIARGSSSYGKRVCPVPSPRLLCLFALLLLLLHLFFVLCPLMAFAQFLATLLIDWESLHI